jgi:hypothetical protein
MIKLIFILLVAQSLLAQVDPSSVESLVQETAVGSMTFNRPDIQDMDFSLPTINKLYKSMTPGAVWTVNLKDESKFTIESIPEVLETPDTERVPAKLLVRVYVFFPGDLKPGADPETALHMAYQAQYIWHDYLNVLVPLECEESFETKSEVNHPCEQGIHMANQLLQLQITGTVRQQDFTDLGLERCIQSKIQMDGIVELPYMKCFIKILGDPKYKDEIIAAKIAEKEKEGYVCNDMGECVMHEDPQVLKALIDNLQKELDGNADPVPINIPFDDRERFCSESQIFQLPLNPNFTNLSYDTYEYGCNHWVNRIYWEIVDLYKLKLATEYVSYKKGEDGNPVFVSKEVQYTSRFEYNNAKYVEVDWKNGERIKEMTLWRTKDPNQVTFAIEFKLGGKNREDRVVKIGVSTEGNFIDSNTPTTMPINGEIVGWNVANTGFGTVIYGVDIKG